MSWSSKSVDFITLFTEDLERSKALYQNVWGVRTASFTDPGGHIWEVAQEVPRADGS